MSLFAGPLEATGVTYMINGTEEAAVRPWRDATRVDDLWLEVVTEL